MIWESLPGELVVEMLATRRGNINKIIEGILIK